MNIDQMNMIMIILLFHNKRIAPKSTFRSRLGFRTCIQFKNSRESIRDEQFLLWSTQWNKAQRSSRLVTAGTRVSGLTVLNCYNSHRDILSLSDYAPRD